MKPKGSGIAARDLSVVIEDVQEAGEIEGGVEEEVEEENEEEDEEDLVDSMRALEIEHFAQVSDLRKNTGLKPPALTITWDGPRQSVEIS